MSDVSTSHVSGPAWPPVAGKAVGRTFNRCSVRNHRCWNFHYMKGVASVCCLADLWIRLIFQGFLGIEFDSTGILKNGDAVPTHHADAVGIWGSASPSSVEIIRPGHGFRFGCSVWCRYPGFILSRSITVTDSNIQELLFLFVSSVSKLCELWTAAICIFWIAIGVWLKVLTESFSPIVVLPCASLL